MEISINKPKVVEQIGSTTFIRFNIKPVENSENMYTFEYIKLANVTDKEVIKELIDSYYNKKCDEEIISGYSYEGVPVWLSQENQLNFKAAFDLCLQLDGATLPLKFKFGTTNKPIYREFTTIDDLKAFYISAISYIQAILHKYWELKDSVNLDEYELPD